MLERTLCGGFAAALALAACGGSTVIADDGAGGDGGGASSSSASSSSTSSGGQSCSAQMPCPPTHYCATAPAACDAVGVCQPRPEGCFDDCPGVCGCDGQFYCNDCGARQAGVDISGDIDCVAEDIEYLAWVWPGGLDHMTIGKANYTNDTCTLVFLAAPMMPDPTFMIGAPIPWAVNYVTAIPSAFACNDMVTGDPVAASAAQGTVSWAPTAMIYPCELTIDAVISFDDPPAGLPATVVMDGVATVQGGCF